MCRRGGICDAVLRQPPQFRRDAIELLFPAHSRIRGDDLHRGIVGFGELDVRKVFPNAFQVCQLLYGHRREIWRIKRNGFPQGCICHAADDGRGRAAGNVGRRDKGALRVIAGKDACPV